MDRLTDKQKREISNILKPALGNTQRERKALLSSSLPEKVLDRIDLEGPPLVFLPNLIDELLRYGEIEKGKHALWAVLEYTREVLGVDYQERVDALRPLFEKPPSPPSTEPLTEEPGSKAEEPSPPPGRTEPTKPLESGPRIEAARPRPAPAPATKEPAAAKQLDPIRAAREYVEQMRPVPPDAPSFYMSPCLVSNELYFCFVRENGDWLQAEGQADSNYLRHWAKDGPRAEHLRLPVTNISFRAAQAFAAWLSELSSQKVRLPRLGEWQIAARAGRSRWLEEAIDAGRVNYFRTARHLHAVDAFKPNPYGIRDLIGQAFDLCVLDDSSRPAIVGGCYHNTDDQLRASLRGKELKSDETCPPDASFRCVRSA